MCDEGGGEGGIGEVLVGWAMGTFLSSLLEAPEELHVIKWMCTVAPFHLS